MSASTSGCVVPTSSLDSSSSRCIATDQSGKHRVIVTPLNESGQSLEKGPRLRFVIMRQAELGYTTKPFTQRHKKRLGKLEPPEPLRPTVAAGPFSDTKYLRLDVFDGFHVNKAPFDATMLHRRMLCPWIGDAIADLVLLQSSTACFRMP
jgi:hypothetical protein